MDMGSLQKEMAAKLKSRQERGGQVPVSNMGEPPSPGQTISVKGSTVVVQEVVAAQTSTVVVQESGNSTVVVQESANAEGKTRYENPAWRSRSVKKPRSAAPQGAAEKGGKFGGNAARNMFQQQLEQQMSQRSGGGGPVQPPAPPRRNSSMTQASTPLVPGASNPDVPSRTSVPIAAHDLLPAAEDLPPPPPEEELVTYRQEPSYPVADGIEPPKYSRLHELIHGVPYGYSLNLSEQDRLVALEEKFVLVSELLKFCGISI